MRTFASVTVGGSGFGVAALGPFPAGSIILGASVFSCTTPSAPFSYTTILLDLRSAPLTSPTAVVDVFGTDEGGAHNPLVPLLGFLGSVLPLVIPNDELLYFPIEAVLVDPFWLRFSAFNIDDSPSTYTFVAHVLVPKVVKPLLPPPILLPLR